jgi:hypothetical protein
VVVTPTEVAAAEATVVAQAMSTVTAVEVDMVVVVEEEEVMEAVLVEIACLTSVMVFKNRAGVSAIQNSLSVIAETDKLQT